MSSFPPTYTGTSRLCEMVLLIGLITCNHRVSGWAGGTRTTNFSCHPHTRCVCEYRPVGHATPATPVTLTPGHPTAPHSDTCRDALRKAFQKVFRCDVARSWTILFNNVNEPLLTFAEDILHNLGVRTSSIRLSVNPNVTSFLEKLSISDGISGVQEKSAILIVTTPEEYANFLDSSKFQTMLSSGRAVSIALVCGGNTTWMCPWESVPPDRTLFTESAKAIIVGIKYKPPGYTMSEVCYPPVDCDVGTYTVDDNGFSVTRGCETRPVEAVPSRGRDALSGRHLVASTNEWPPFVIRRENSDGGGVRYEGFCIDLWHQLAERLNFTYEFVEPADGEWGRLINGTWTGLVGQLQRREVDVAVAPLSAQPARSPVMDVSLSYLQLEGKLLVTRTARTQHRNLLYVFTVPVLVLVAICPLLVAVMLVGLERLTGSSDDCSALSGVQTTPVVRIADAILLVYGAVVCQASLFRPQSISGRTLLAFWWLFVIVFVNTFSAFMIANLAAPPTKHEINTLTDLVDSPYYKWGMLGSTIFPHILKNSNNTLFKKLWEGISKLKDEDSLVMSDDFRVHMARMRAEKYAYLGPVPALDFYNATHCDFRSGRDSFFTARYVLGLPKHSPFTDVLSRELLDFEELGFMLSIKRRWFHVATTCDSQNTHTQTVVGFVHVETAYFALAAGISFALFVLISEKLLHFCTAKLRYRFKTST